MRGEREMTALILDFAERDDRIRAVIMGGSRANPTAWRDEFQDFDIAYLVTDVSSFTQNHEWISVFGELMILQMPDLMSTGKRIPRPEFTYLMQFQDGNRIDLTLAPLDRTSFESLSLVLLDKDGRLNLPPPSERDHYLAPPSENEFADCCNEFWWVAPYVAKGLWRGEIIYAKHHLDHILRREMMRMVEWFAGVEHGFDRSIGKHGRELRRYLSRDQWSMLERTFAGADEEDNWQALFSMSELFRSAARRVAEEFSFDYPSGDDSRVSAHLRRVWAGEFGLD